MLALTSYQGLVDTFSFSKLAEGCRDLVPLLWSTREMYRIVLLAEKLVSNFWQPTAEEGLRLPTKYQAMEELPLF